MEKGNVRKLLKRKQDQYLGVPVLFMILNELLKSQIQTLQMCSQQVLYTQKEPQQIWRKTLQDIILIILFFFNLQNFLP